MKCMILAAGLGTRLRPVTETTPKALVEVHGEPLLGLQIRKLVTAGFDEIIVNVHHHPTLVKDFLKNYRREGVRIEISDESVKLLDTGGGLKKASWFFDDGKPFLLHNVDVLHTIDLGFMYRKHLEDGPLATLAVSDRVSSRYLFFNEERLLRGWKNIRTGITIPANLDETGLAPFAFSGIHVIDPSVFELMGSGDRFSLIEIYLQACASSEIRAFEHDPAQWADIGTPGSLEKVNREWNGKIFH